MLDGISLNRSEVYKWKVGSYGLYVFRCGTQNCLFKFAHKLETSSPQNLHARSIHQQIKIAVELEYFLLNDLQGIGDQLNQPTLKNALEGCGSPNCRQSMTFTVAHPCKVTENVCWI